MERRASGDQLAQVWLALFFVAVAVGLLQWPIVAVDTDLWYHLNAARQMLAERTLPATAFFSFLRPPPAALDYYWLAQLGLYGVHSVAGPIGLVLLRAVLALATLGFALAALRAARADRAGWVWTAVAFTPVALHVLERFAAIRPHAASYLLIAVFLWALEARRGVLALPVLALLWVNLHGIEYPVMGLILGAYGAEWLLARPGWTPAARPAFMRELGVVVAAAACVLLTPHGLGLVTLPFSEVSFAAQYIEELKPPVYATWLSFGLDGLLWTRESMASAVLVLAAVAALASLRRTALRPAHLLLFVGGLVLLARMQRFSVEFSLLVLPLLGAFRAPAIARGALPRALAAGVLVVLALLPFRYLWARFDAPCSFPVCARDLPDGAVAFLDQVDARGDVLNHPNHGGYLEWELFPRQRIFVDLQTPFLFPDTAIHAADQAFQDPFVLAGLVAEYRPAFVLAPNRLRVFAAVIARFPDYAPVFVDDAAVLYASAAQNGELVERYRLRALDPFALDVIGGRADRSAAAAAAAELRRINQIHPAGGRTQTFEGVLALERGDVATALERADDVLRFHAARPEGWRLRGDALFQSQRFAEAEGAYEAALERIGVDSLGKAQRPYLEGQLWSVYTQLGQPERAYRAARRALPDIYAADVGYDELVALGRAALDSGHDAEGRRLLEFALAKTPPQETRLREWIQARLRASEAAP